VTAPAAGNGWPQRWLSKRAVRLHLTLLIVFPGCLAAGWFELTRAESGNGLSWVYVFEWPFFAAFAAYLWWRLLHPEDEHRAAGPAKPARGAAVTSAGHQADDPELRAWNEYLTRLHAQSPPGGPPAKRRR